MAMRNVAGTNLIATVPKRLAMHDARNRELKIVKAPKPMSCFPYLLAWHSRMDSVAAHTWLRTTVKGWDGSLMSSIGRFAEANERYFRAVVRLLVVVEVPPGLKADRIPRGRKAGAPNR
jgi:hypothetical protein